MAATALASAVIAMGCERRIEEPTPTRDPTAVARRVPDYVVPPASATASAAPTPSTTSPAATVVMEATPPRCVHATPETPVRAAKRGSDPRCPKDTGKAPKLRSAKVSFPEAGSAGAAVAVEVAEQEEERMRGLMFRKSMADDRGMIFTFEEKSRHAFWMHNTCISLDMLFIDDDGMIVGIEESTPTVSDDTFDVGCPSKFVLEVNAGWSRAHGVKAGQHAKIEGL